MANGEKYQPSSVPFFLQYTKLGSNSSFQLNIANIPVCTADCSLTSKKEIKSSTSQLEFFKGEDPNDTPTYAVVKQDGAITHIYYWFFFPYNQGKQVCVGYYGRNSCSCPEIFGHCLCPRINGCVGFYKQFGNHVGDWEHFRVSLKNEKPISIKLSYHGKSLIFKYNGTAFVSKNQQNIKFYGSHPVVYSAKGKDFDMFGFLCIFFK